MKNKLKSQLFDSDFLKKLEQLVITSKITLVDGAAGNRKSRAKGSSVEFSDYREYSIGDDFKRIDWNAYGRFEKLFIKLFMEEREAPVHIFLDNSKSMDWGEPNKGIASRRLAAALSYISLSSYDRVSLVCLNNTVDKYKPDLRGKNSFTQILNLLENLEYSGTTDIFNTIAKFNLKSGKGISIVISDLFTKGNLLDMINYLQFKKQEIYICHVLAPQEVEPEIGMSLRLIDIESGEFRDVTSSPDLIKSYKKVYKRFITNIEEICKKRGVNYIFMESSLPVERMVRKVVSSV
ncbi:DUF58 domain-containing protein [Acetivibrio clariflavus]|uniref:DUF58 domain-containing protein n=1 Tax=Acetivibrio clariflavus TaxID=288965 RepID=UPI0004B582A6|nr:DUF58 domain-containing protein [Acetivibrio clariflavus]HOQ01572.1 DUF58 domain-containing protein [Acetivibrio clariflavus]